MTTNESARKQEPYHSDAAYLDAEFSWLRLHVSLLDLERRFEGRGTDDVSPSTSRVGEAENVASKELNRRLGGLQKDVEATRQAVDAKLETHRKAGTFKLGLDVLTERYQLSPDERFILLALALPAVSAPLSMDIYATMGVFSGTLQIQEVVSLLQPAGVEDWLRYRRLFQVSNPLIKHGLITVDYPGREATPGDLWYADVSLTRLALAIIAGDPDINADGNADNGSDDVH